jgi:hypothetical protein
MTATRTTAGRRRARNGALWLVGLILALPTAARAQGFFDAVAGAVSGGIATNTGATYGGDLGYFAKALGVEGDYSFSVNIGPATSSPPGLTLNHLDMRSVSGDLLFGPRFGQWHAYGAVGAGVIGGVATNSDIFKLSLSAQQNDLALNVGGGVIGYVYGRLGVRVDVRYFKDLLVSQREASAPSSFIRFGVGLVLKL